MSYCLPLVQMYVLLTVFSAYSDGCDCRTKFDPNHSYDLVLSISHSLYKRVVFHADQCLACF